GTVPMKKAKKEGKLLQETLAAAPTSPNTLFVIDAAAPWGTVAAAANAAVAAGRTHVRFVFTAGAAGKTTPPPKSAIDADVDALMKVDPTQKAAKLADPKD